MRTVLLILLTALLAAVACSQEDIVGTWQGTLDAGPMQIRIVFNISRDGDSLVTTIDSPDQGVKGIPVAQTGFSNGDFKLTARAIAAEFEGRLDGDKLTGEWRQGGQAFPLILTRGQVAEARRPQDPVPPFPYLVEDVTFPGPAGTLAGTLTRPEGDGPFPGITLISGSGAQNRDEEIFGHRPFAVLADYLTRRGFAVLRCDDRGVGGSTGDPTTATSRDFAEDARAELDWLRTRPDIDAARTGVIGHSEGALIGAMLGADDAPPAFIVMLAGSGVTGEKLLELQGELVLRAGGMSEAGIEVNRRLQGRLFQAARRDLPHDELRDELRKVINEELEKLDPDIRAELNLTTPQAVAAQVEMVASPWFRYFFDYDPAEDLRQVKAPVLALIGSRDLQVPAHQNLPAIEAALQAGGNQDYTVKELPGLNHLFQTAQTGAIQEYARIEETFSPTALKVIGDWLEER